MVLSGRESDSIFKRELHLGSLKRRSLTNPEKFFKKSESISAIKVEQNNPARKMLRALVSSFFARLAAIIRESAVWMPATENAKQRL